MGRAADRSFLFFKDRCRAFVFSFMLLSVGRGRSGYYSAFLVPHGVCQRLAYNGCHHFSECEQMRVCMCVCVYVCMCVLIFLSVSELCSLSLSAPLSLHAGSGTDVTSVRHWWGGRLTPVRACARGAAATVRVCELFIHSEQAAHSRRTLTGRGGEAHALVSEFGGPLRAARPTGRPRRRRPQSEY